MLDVKKILMVIVDCSVNFARNSIGKCVIININGESYILAFDQGIYYVCLSLKLYSQVGDV